MPLIHEKIVKIMKEVTAISKKVNPKSEVKFAYRGVDEFYNTLHPIMSSHGVFTVPVFMQSEWTERQTASGKINHHARTTYKYIFYAEDGSSVEAVVEAEGADTQDKLTGKALSYAHKYVLAQVFMIPTGDMPDPDSIAIEESEVETNPEKILMPFGSNKGKPLGQISKTELASSIVWAKSKGKFLEFANAAQRLIDEQQKAPLKNYAPGAVNK